MKKFLKFIGTLTAVFSTVIGALALFETLTQKKKIKNGYLECEVSENNIDQ